MKRTLPALLLAAWACAPAPRGPAGTRAARLDVPFYANTSDQCGPAALASVLSFWGARADPAALRPELYRRSLGGSLPVDLTLAARRRGFRAEMYQGSLEDLRRRIDQGRPVLAFLNVWLRHLPQGHFVVVTGYDDARGGVYVHDGRRRDRFLRYSRLESAWSKTRRWTLIVEPPDARAG